MSCIKRIENRRGNHRGTETLRKKGMYLKDDLFIIYIFSLCLRASVFKKDQPARMRTH